MAEPTGSALPSAYDDDNSLLGELLDHRSFKLQSAVTATATTIPVVNSVGDVDLPVYIVFDDQNDMEDNEVIYCDTVGTDGQSFINVTRGARNSTAQSHSADAPMYLAYMGKHATLLLKAILAAQKYQGLTGPATSMPGSPVAGEVFVDTDNDKVYWAVDNSGSPEFRQYGIIDHGEYGTQGDDDHSQYHNDTRAGTWHDGLTGAHVQDGDSHDHSKGDGCGRVQSGPTTGRGGTATYEREIYYDTDTDELYIANASLNWVKIVGAPSDAIVMWRDLSNHSSLCPTGWSRFTDLDSRFPLGCETGNDVGDYSPQYEGSDNHTHDYTDIPQHYHSVTGYAATVITSGNHAHGPSVYSGSGGGGLHDSSGIPSSGSTGTGTGGTHTHTVDAPADSTDSTKRTSDDAAGVSTGTTTSEDGRPPFYTVVFCEKD
jgi:hypothetical protein